MIALVAFATVGAASRWAPVAAEPAARDPWIAQGLASAERDGLRAFLANGVDDEDLAGGSLILVRRGETIFREGVGLADRRSKTPYGVELPCRIASISKSFIAALVARLVEAGKLDFEAPIDRWIPDFKAVNLAAGGPSPRAPLLRECLEHTAGFVADEEPGGRPWLAKHSATWTLADQTATVVKAGLVRAPGERFAYSGTGYDVIGRVIEVVTGLSLDEAARVHLFEPLGLAHTTYAPTADVVAALPTHYYLWESDGHLHADLTPRVFPPTGRYRSVGGGIVSTLDDVARFWSMELSGGVLDGKRVMSAASLRTLRTKHAPATSYALGRTLGPPLTDDRDSDVAWVGHSGSTGTLAWADFEHELVGVFLMQGNRVKGRLKEGVTPVIEAGTAEFAARLRKHVDALFGTRRWK